MSEKIGLPNKELFRINEVAEYFCVEHHTIRDWIKRRGLKCERIGGSLRITRTEIKRFRSPAVE